MTCLLWLHGFSQLVKGFSHEQNMPGFHLSDLIFQTAAASFSAALSAQSPNELRPPVQYSPFSLFEFKLSDQVAACSIYQRLRLRPL